VWQRLQRQHEQYPVCDDVPAGHLVFFGILGVGGDYVQKNIFGGVTVKESKANRMAGLSVFTFVDARVTVKTLDGELTKSIPSTLAMRTWA